MYEVGPRVCIVENYFRREVGMTGGVFAMRTVKCRNRLMNECDEV